MSPLPNLRQFVKELKRFSNRSETAGLFMLVVFFFATASAVSAQTITWTDRFVQGVAPSQEQCQKWGAFLKDLGGKEFASVTMRGEFDQVGRTISDPAAATKLADLMHKKEEGYVISGGHTWRVTHCDFSVCQDGRSISLSVDGAEQCACTDTYTLRPQSQNGDWGGINTGTSCNAKTQSMTLEFHSGVSIIPQGPTFICEDGNVDLKAESNICLPVESYTWTNEAGQTVGTGQIFNAREAGFYSVTVTGAGNCSATSAPAQVASTDVTVDAGPNVPFCGAPVQLNAVARSVGGTGSTMVNKVCLFDAFGLFGGNCAFTAYDICMDGTERITSRSYAKTVSFSNPVKLRYKLYHAANSISTFTFRLNGHEIGSYTENNTRGTCVIIGAGGAPFTFEFTADKFKQHWLKGTNSLSVDVRSTGTGVDLAGIAVEVVTSDESYSWSPAAGLNLASIQNPIASPTVATEYIVTYTDPSGCIAKDTVKVTMCAAPPTAACNELTVPVDAGKCTATVDQTLLYDSDPGSTVTYTISDQGPYEIGENIVTITASNASGNTTCTAKIIVTDPTSPEVVKPEDVIADNDEGECFATVEPEKLGQPEVSDNCDVTLSRDHNDNIFPIGETTVTWTATDTYGNKTTTTQKVTVVNAIPVINSVVISTPSVIANDPVSLAINYWDNNIKEATIEWGDNTAVETVIQPDKNFEVTHTFANSGSYSARITLTDKCGETTFSYTSIVVSNPRSGSVSGGGWFISPRGAYPSKPNASGKATFAFDVSNLNRNHIPEGHIVFNFHEVKLKFRSTHIERLRIRDEDASITAVGRLNGERDYRILISVAEGDEENEKDKGNGKNWNNDDRNRDKDRDRDDEDRDDDDKYQGDKHQIRVDLIRVKIWDPNGNVIYDTQMLSPDGALATTPIGGGSVKMKQEKLNFNEKFQSPVATSSGQELSSVYPNPFTDWVDVEFSSGSNQDVSIQVMDLSGKVIYNEVFPVSEDGRYPLDIPEREKAEPGIYLLVIKQGKKVEILRLIRN